MSVSLDENSDAKHRKEFILETLATETLPVLVTVATMATFHRISHPQHHLSAAEEGFYDNLPLFYRGTGTKNVFSGRPVDLR